MVEWKSIGEISSNVFAGGTPSTKHEEYYDGDIPWIRSGEIDFNVITKAERNITTAGYKNSSAKLIRKGSVVMAMTGATVAKSAIVDFETTANQSVCAIETVESIVNYKFVFYSLAKDYFKIRSSAQGALTSLNLAMIKQLQIPIPSLSEQQRIVSILDTFTSSISNLKQQIEERRKQYEYERDLLLDLEGKEGVEMKKLGDFAEIGTGSSNTQDELESGRYPFFVRSQIVKWKDDYEFDEIAIITSGDGVGVGKVLHYYEGKYALHQRAYRIHVENDSIVPKFIFYFMQKDFYWYIMSNAYAASVTSVRRPMLINYPIPIPPLSTQSRIVSILDTFEQSISNLEEQLAMREKQYEYYRNQLLTFEGEEERGKT